jgi:DNA-binding transcriptional LysR family regulator
METYELKYFLAVAGLENIHRAAEKAHVSPGSLSKAIARLEAELGVPLFRREKRHIRLTEAGRLLQKRAARIVELEESARREIGGRTGPITVVVAGPEVLLAKIGVGITRQIRGRAPDARFEWRAVSEREAIAMADRREAQLALISGEPPRRADLDTRLIQRARFSTFVGAGHPLSARARAGKPVPVREVLQHPFVSPDGPLLGSVGARDSWDGWRDDRFPRRIDYFSSSLKILEELVVGGLAVAYLPEYVGASLPITALRIPDCPYVCVQRIQALTPRPAPGWLDRLF